jgi:hypothetical protein
MSLLGKIFLGLAALGLVASLTVGYLLSAKYADSRTAVATAATQNAAATAEAAKQKKLAEAAALAQKEAETKAADATAKLTDLTTQLTAAQAKADDATKALDSAKADAAKATADLADLNKQLDGKTIPDIIAARDKAQKDLESSQSEQKIMADQLQAANNSIAKLTDDINASKIGKIPPGVSGKVTFVNRTWNFVVIDVGLNNSVVPNGTLIVYRKNTFLGKIKVTTADANSAVADILPDAKGDIQVGDYVLN